MTTHGWRRLVGRTGTHEPRCVLVECECGHVAKGTSCPLAFEAHEAHQRQVTQAETWGQAPTRCAALVRGSVSDEMELVGCRCGWRGSDEGALAYHVAMSLLAMRNVGNVRKEN